MKVLNISRGGLELGCAHVLRPLATVGRSPTCDIVLRAPGVAPVHFVLEWVGEGDFSPENNNRWSIYDVSGSEEGSGEGTLLDGDRAEFKDFIFSWTQDSLLPLPEIGGMINPELGATARSTAQDQAVKELVLEAVVIRESSGTIEEFQHLRPKVPVSGWRKWSPWAPSLRFSPIAGAPEFSIRPLGAGMDLEGEILLSPAMLSTAMIHRNGNERVPASELASARLMLRNGEHLRISWQDHTVFLRFVEQAPLPEVEERRIREPLLFKLSMGGGGIALLLSLTRLLISGDPAKEPDPEAPKPEVRVARVEVMRRPPPSAPSETAVAPKEVVQTKAPPQEAEDQQAEGRKAPTLASRAKGSPKAKSVAARPAQPQDISSMGVLGALKKAQGSMTSNAKSVDERTVTQAVTGDEGRVLLKAALPSSVGKPQGGHLSGETGGLNAAASRVTAAEGYKPQSSGALTGSGSKMGTTAGSALGGGKGGKGTGAGSIGDLGAGGLSVSGGLDRETVRRVIVGHRAFIRACYERTLLTRPQINGRISFQWEISPKGPVVTAKATKSDIDYTPLENCVKDVILSMKFPVAHNGNSTVVIYPFVFQAN